MTKISSLSIRAGIIALVSATAATSHEVVWGRVLSHVVGNTAWGIGLALTLFMVGMGAGSLVTHRFMPRLSRFRRSYIAIEVVIAVGALLADAAFLWAGLPSAYLGGDMPGMAHTVVDLVYVFAAAVLPALAIGATYPLLVAAVVKDATNSKLLTSLYLSGLVGGVVGVLLASIIVVPRIGFDGAAIVGSTLNLVAALLAFLFLEARSPRTTANEGRQADEGLGKALLVFSAAGILGLGSQVVWNRSIVAYAGVSTFSFSTIIAVYLLAQAVGMVLGRRMTGKTVRSATAWALGLMSGVALLSLGPLSATAALIPSRDAAPAIWLLSSGLTILVAVGPAAFLLGVAQCGALRLIESRSGDWARGAAWVSGLGTIFSAASAALTAMVLFPLLGPRWSIAVLGGGGLLVLLVQRRFKVATASVLATALLLVVSPGPRYFLGTDYESAPLLYADHGVQDTTAIILKDLPLERRIRRLVANGMSYSGDSLFAQRYMRLLGHLPALAAKGERRALVICIGTGSTAAALVPYRYKRVDAVDISPSIRTTLSYFKSVNQGLENRSRVRITVEDGERWMRLTSNRYDVITLEPPPPRAPGASALYSREFYEIARSHLSPGGVFAQWLPLHGLTAWEANVITKTFLEVFPTATLHLAERNEAILLGGVDGAHLQQADKKRLGSERVQQDLARIGMKGMDPLKQTLIAGPRALAALTESTPVMRYAWPVTELMPLGSPRTGRLDQWAERLASLAGSSGAPTVGSMFLSALPAFIRVQEGRARPADKKAVYGAMLKLLSSDPHNEYSQYMFGFGDYLNRRLKQQVKELPERDAQQVQRLMARQRALVKRLGGDLGD